MSFPNTTTTTSKKVTTPNTTTTSKKVNQSTKDQAKNSLLENFSRTENHGLSKADNSIQRSQLLAAIREWLGLKKDSSSAYVPNEQNSVNAKNLIETITTHRGIRGWSVFSSTKFGTVLTNTMKDMIKNLLTYKDIVALYNECAILHKPNSNQLAFINYFNEIEPDLKQTHEYKVDEIKKSLLKDLNAVEGGGWDDHLMMVVNGCLTADDEFNERQIIAKAINRNSQNVISTQSVLFRLDELKKFTKSMPQVSPSIILKQHQNNEIRITQQWSNRLRILDANELQNTYFGVEGSEFKYIKQRINQIITQVGNKYQVDYEGLLQAINDTNSFEPTQLLEQINRQQTQVERGLKETEIPGDDKLLLQEGFALLRQLITLRADRELWEKSKPKIDGLNSAVYNALVEIKGSMSDRFQALQNNIGNFKQDSNLKTIADSINKLTPPTDKEDSIKNNPTKKEPVGRYLSDVESILREIHNYENNFIKNLSPQLALEFLNKNNDIIFKNMNEKMTNTISNNEDRKNLDLIHDCSSRVELRHQKMVNNLLLHTMQQHPQGLFLLKTLELIPFTNPNTSEVSKVDLRLLQSAQNTLELLGQDNYPILRGVVFSVEEFSARINIANNTTQNTTGSSNNSALNQVTYDTLNLSALRQWSDELQQIWIETLFYEQEQEILGISSQPVQQQKMSECFRAWILEKIGIPFPYELPFLKVQVKDTKKMLNRNHLESINQFQTKYRGRIRGAQAANNSQNTNSSVIQEVHHGFDIESIPKNIAVSNEQVNEVDNLNGIPGFVTGMSAGNQPIDANLQLLKLSSYPNGAAIAEKIEWVEWIFESLTLPVSRSIVLYLYSCFRSVGIDLGNTPSDSTNTQFLQLFLEISFADEWGVSVFNRGNSWRKVFLNTYLNIIGNGPINVTQKNRKYLVQFCLLAERPLPEINIDDNVPDDFSIEKVGTMLQGSPIGLEGLDESEIELAFQSATQVPKTPQTRSFIDYLRARSSLSLAISSLQYVFAYSSMDVFEAEQAVSDQDWDRVFRAVTFAFIVTAIERVEQYFAVKLPQWKVNEKELDVNSATLTPPPIIFKADIMLELFPNQTLLKAEKYNEIVKNFNTNLIRSGDTSRMLMGYAREIVRLTRVFQVKRRLVNFTNLLRIKIAYQYLRKDYFKSEDKICGFLKIYVDNAECAITSSVFDISKFTQNLTTERFDKIAQRCVKPMFESNGSSYADSKVLGVFKPQQEQNLKINHIKPSIISFGKTEVNCISGSVYHDGYECEGIPPVLYNHPHLRSTGLHGLQYLHTGNSYCYYSNIDGIDENKLLQIEILYNSDDEQVIIHKNLPINFDNSSELEMLQFLPLESQVSIPAAIKQRLDIEHIWYDQNNKMYGYNSQGDLVASFKQKTNPPSWDIETKNKKFISISSKTFPFKVNSGQQVFDQLLTCIPCEEILLGVDGKSFFIPAINLHIRLNRAGINLLEKWICESTEISNMVIDLENVEPYLALKPKEEQKIPSKLKSHLNNLRLELAEQEGIATPSLVVKHNIKRLRISIAKLESEIAKKYKRKLYVMVHLTGSSGNSILSGMPELLENQLAYAQEETKYRASFVGSLPTLYFENSQDNRITPRDLHSCLYLIQNISQDALKDDYDVGKLPAVNNLIHELAKHHFSSPLNKQTKELLLNCSQTVKQLTDDSTQYQPLALYLELLLCQNALLEMEGGIQLYSEDQDKIDALRNNFKVQQTHCREFLDGISDRNFPSEVLILMHKFCPNVANVLTNNSQAVTQGITPFPEISAQHLLSLSKTNLLERFFQEDAIVARKKLVDTAISPHQLELVGQFQSHSPEQVQGFYLEEFGYFNLETVCSKLSVGGTFSDSEGILGIKRLDIESILKKLCKLGYINNNHDYYFVVTDKKSPSILFQSNEILALMADMPLAANNKKIIAEKLRRFFLEAASSGSVFTFKDAAAEKLIDSKLQVEKEIHTSKLLDAEYFLKTNFPSLSMVECKRAVLTGQFPGSIEVDKLPGLRNALIRYLFHKTEMQHIENIQKAPMLGERNKIELLNNKRQYDIDLVFKEGLTGNQKTEKIIQLAFLLFEENYGYRCNANQVELFRALMLPDEHPESIDAIQARMGFGKTALLPLLALVQIALESEKPAQEKSLVRYIVPRAVIEDNSTSFNKQLFDILGSNVIKDKEFSRYPIGEDKIASFNLIIEDLEQRLQFYHDARDKGIVLIQWPEIRQSMEAQELALGHMIVTNALVGDEVQLCLRCKQVLGQIRSITTYTVFDELDATQDFKSCEVNYTEGKKIPIAKLSLVPLVSLIKCIQQQQNTSPEQLVRPMLNALGIQEQHQTLIDYLLKPTNGLDSLDRQVNYSQEEMQGILLVRALLLDPNILSFITNKQPNTHFGIRFKVDGSQMLYYGDQISKSTLLIAVPYEGTNTPKGMSIFDNTEVAAIATICYYLSLETLLEKEPHLDFLITQMRQSALPSEIAVYVKDVNDNNGNIFLDRLRDLAFMQDKSEIKLAKDRFYNDFLQNPSDEVRIYFGAAVVATQVRSDEVRANSDRYEMGSLSDKIRGCSGTIGGTSSYFLKPKIDPASDGKLSLEIMGRANNSKVHVLEDSDNLGETHLIKILNSLLGCANQDTRAIIDVAGICKSPDGTPESVVAQLWRILKSRNDSLSKIQGIVYYGKDNIKRVYRGPTEPPIMCTSEMEMEALSDKRYFSFYGQRNARGSDIKQADSTHALVTMDENVTNSDAKQAVLRFRGLVNRNSNQTFSFVLTGKFYNILIQHTESIQDKGQKQEIKQHKRPVKINASVVANYLRNTEIAQEMQDSLIIFQKELSAHVKQAATYIEHSLFKDCDLDGQAYAEYQKFLLLREDICSSVEHSIVDLKDKYGAGLQNMDRARYVNGQVAHAQKSINKLFQLKGKFASSMAQLHAVQIDNESEKAELFFNNRVKHSAEIFLKRYTKKTVCIPKVNSGAIAIAQAQAQAQAQALAEALAENLNQSEVVAVPRKDSLRVQMINQQHFPITQYWLRNPTGQTWQNWQSPIKNLIHPDLRGRVMISPHLQAQQLVPHFVLYSDNRNLPYVLVSQDEAAAFLYFNTYNQPTHEYRWVADLHMPVSTNTPLDIKKLGGLALNDLSIPDGRISALTTKDLTKDLPRELFVVSYDQLLPHLNVTVNPQVKLDNIIEFKKFGVSRVGSAGNTSISFSITVKSETVNVGVGKISVEILKKNAWFNEAIRYSYNRKTSVANKLQPQNKLLENAYVKFLDSTKEQRNKLAELEKKLHELQRDKANEITSIIASVSNFELTDFMARGLRERDDEVRYSPINGGPYKEHIQNCGAKFIERAERIIEFQSKLQGNDLQVPAILKQLEGEFDQFVSKATMEAAIAERNSASKGRLSTTPLFDGKRWATIIEDATTPVFDIVYGRIIHYAHIGDVVGAKGCHKLDCQQMYTKTLPNMLDAIESIGNAVIKMKRLMAEISPLIKNIEMVKIQMKDIIAANECFTMLQIKQAEIESQLIQQGISFSKEAGEFFDMFRLENLAQWNTGVFEVEGVLPDYENVVLSFESGYKSCITALTESENQTLEKHNNLLKHVLHLSAQVEERGEQIKEINKK
ncbi:MAG: golgin subfamily er 1 [Pseudomonadota bacterium]|nr:golgin subfamily er 1 [Pseudomonadota bacterium]